MRKKEERREKEEGGEKGEGARKGEEGGGVRVLVREGEKGVRVLGEVQGRGGGREKRGKGERGRRGRRGRRIFCLQRGGILILILTLMNSRFLFIIC